MLEKVATVSHLKTVAKPLNELTSISFHKNNKSLI